VFKNTDGAGCWWRIASSLGVISKLRRFRPVEAASA
jgi:hypothetical protein